MLRIMSFNIKYRVAIEHYLIYTMHIEHTKYCLDTMVYLDLFMWPKGMWSYSYLF